METLVRRRAVLITRGYCDGMSIGGDERTSWTRVAVVLLALFLIAMVVSFVLRLLKFLIMLGLVLVGVVVLLRALRPRR
jgi:hypothetical protein